MQNTKILLKQLVSRLSLALVAAVGFCMGVSAENKVSMDNLNIKPGETKTIAVYLDNSDAMSSLQMDIELPYGLSCNPNTLTRDEARLDRDSHSIFMNRLQSGSGTGNQKYRLAIFSSDAVNIMGDSGAIAYFDVTANDNLIETRDIVLSNIVGSSSEKSEETGFTVKYELEDYTANVSPNIGQLFFADDSLSVKVDGASKKVDVSLINYVNVRGLQAVVALPEGLSFETKDNGKPRFEYGARLPENATISSNIAEDGNLHIAISDITGGTIAKEEKDTTILFSFYVKASEALAETSDITLGEVVISDNGNHGIEVYGTSTVKIHNSFIIYYTPANDSVQGLRTRYEAAVEKINTEAADVKDSAIVVNAVQEVATRINDLQKAVDEAYANETLAAIYDEVLAPVAEIDTAIVDMVEMVLDYQLQVTANEEAYTRLTADIAAVQAKLDAAKTTIETDYAEVAEQFTADIAALQEDVDSISNEVKGLYDEVKLTAESQIDATAIEAGIEKVLADAEKAHEGSSIYGVKNANGAGLTGIYTIDGSRVAEPVKGQVNIFKYSDGTVKKFYMK